MAVPPALTKTPQRTSPQFTVGNPDKSLALAATSAAPNVGSLPKNPHPITLIGVDAQSASTAIGNHTAGDEVTFSFLIPFPNIPTPFVVGTNDFATFIVSQIAISHARTGQTETAIPGLVLASLILSPVAYARQQLCTVEQLQLNQTYTGWAAQVSGTLYCAANSTAGALTVRAHGALYDILG